MRRWIPLLLVAMTVAAGAVVAVPATGFAAPPALAQPPPPPNPDDDELRRSGNEVDRRAGEVGRLTSRLAELDSRTDDLQAALAAERENAEAAFVALGEAQDAAVAAQARADDARVATDAAGVAITQAQDRLDVFLTATYQQGLDLGPLGLLSEASNPDELVDRAGLRDAVAQQQVAAQAGLERAFVDRANADSLARAARDEAQQREAAAAAAKTAADAAFAAADAAAREQAALLAAVADERAQVQAQLDAAEAADSGLRAQRQRFDDWTRAQAAAEAARLRAERDAAAVRVSSAASVSAPPAAPGRAAGPAVRGGAGVQRVIDRAMSQLGVQYVWGGGNGRGPSTGIPDGLGSPLDRVGFDCSGLMLYAFNGVGVSLPRVSRNQFNAGRKVPVSDLRAGDMVFYRNGGAPIHHVALYIGNGKMIEAPYTGADVRVVPLRKRGLVPQATRML